MSKLPIEVKTNFYLHKIQEQLEEQGIVGLHVQFEDENKAKEFCGEDGYFLVARDANPLSPKL